MNEPAALLHNMSVPPNSTIRYNGLQELVVNSFGAGSKGLGSIAYAKPAARPLIFAVCLPASVQSADPIDLLRALDGVVQDDPLAQLCSLIDAQALALPLPDACALKTTAPIGQRFTSDLLTALAILTKCSGRVWLRAKGPSLAAALNRRTALLLVPWPFSDRLQLGARP
ncbi:MAG: hypothetical protein NT107_03665 [Planctomycetota bacterium]|nr:hypothetical protein [Planctomycetota bacterium]